MNKIIFKFSFLFLMIISSISKAQDPANTPKTDTLKKEKRTGTSDRNNISAHIGVFDPWVGVYYERLLSPYLGVDVAIGLIGGSIGVKGYFPKVANGKASFYTGFSEGILLTIGAKHYIPVGCSYLGNNGFRVSLDIGPQIYYDSGEEIQFGLSLKLGKSF
jgi:hypothetical protein